MKNQTRSRRWRSPYSLFLIGSLALLSLLFFFAHRQSAQPPDFAYLPPVLKSETTLIYADLIASSHAPSHPQRLSLVRPAPPASPPQSVRLSAPIPSAQHVAPNRNQLASAVSSASTVTPHPSTLAPDRIPILMYHYVRTVTNPKDRLGIRLSVTPKLFAAQMQYLADNGYTTLTMEDLYSILAGRQPLPRKPIALTFDDGYEDFYTSAWPILQQHHFKATSYIITGFVGGGAYMTWDQIRQLDASGMVDFGAHTEHHVDLRGLSASRLWNEVDGSKVDMEQHLGHPVLDFCYPSGEYTSRVIADVQRAGFESATTTHYGLLQSLQWAFTMPRVRVTGTDSIKVWEARLP